MEWTSEERLRLIRALGAKSIDGLQGRETLRMLMERIINLCDAPAVFLEMNKEHYEDVIKLAGLI